MSYIVTHESKQECLDNLKDFFEQVGLGRMFVYLFDFIQKYPCWAISIAYPEFGKTQDLNIPCSWRQNNENGELVLASSSQKIGIYGALNELCEMANVLGIELKLIITVSDIAFTMGYGTTIIPDLLKVLYVNSSSNQSNGGYLLWGR